MIPELCSYTQFIFLIENNIKYTSKSKTFLFKIAENPDVLADPVFDGREMPNSLEVTGKTKTVIFKFYTYLKDSQRAYYLAEGDENYFFILEW
jgi:hypothetical protein